MNKKLNLLIPAAVAVLAVLMLVLAPKLIPKTVADEDMVIVSVDGHEFARVPLSRPQTLTVKQDNGEVNVIVITENGVHMESSTCHNQKCVMEGELNRDNWEFRPNQCFIICLPNRVTVELAVKQ